MNPLTYLFVVGAALLALQDLACDGPFNRPAIRASAEQHARAYLAQIYPGAAVAAGCASETTLGHVSCGATVDGRIVLLDCPIGSSEDTCQITLPPVARTAE